MKKGYKVALVATLIGGVILVSCEKKHYPPVDPYPTIERLLSDGWTAYKEGEYRKAVAKFDSVIEIKADVVEAHIGAGWSRMHLGEFKEAHANFALTITVGGRVRPTINIWKENSKSYVHVDTVQEQDTIRIQTLWVMKPFHAPVLGFPELKIVSDLRGKNVKEVLYDITSFNDTIAILEWSKENTDTIFVIDGDTLRPPFPPDSTDVLRVNYTYYKGGETKVQVDGYCGDAAAFSGDNRYEHTLIQANAVIKMDPAYQFVHDSKITARRVRILLAQSYYNLKMFTNAVKEVLILDPTWKYDPKSDTFLYQLLKKIEYLLERG